MSLSKFILLVEDSLRDAELILDALQPHKLSGRVIHLRDGEEALDYLYRRGSFAGRTSGQPILILLDLKLPKVDGLEVLRQIKGDRALSMLPVVMMTSSLQEQDLVQSYELGVNAYVVKPMKFQDFVEAVKQVSGFWAGINEVPGSSNRSESPDFQPALIRPDKSNQ